MYDACQTVWGTMYYVPLLKVIQNDLVIHEDLGLFSNAWTPILHQRFTSVNESLVESRMH
jgi:hypothetical protein